MEPLTEHLRELDYDYSRAAGFEKRFVYDPVVGLAYTQVEDHNTGERYNSFPRDGVHPKLTFERPQTQLIIRIGDEAMARTTEFEALDGRGTQ